MAISLLWVRLSVCWLPAPHVSRARSASSARRVACLAATAALGDDPVLAGRAVAEWCVAADRAQATVAVSSAATLAQALRDFWSVARAFAEDGGERGRQRILAFPAWSRCASDYPSFQRVLQHLQDCSEVCEYLGESLVVTGRHPSAPASEDEPRAVPCPMLVLRSFTQRAWGDYSEENSGLANPFATTPESVAMDGGGGGGGETASDADVLSSTRQWVEGIICKVKVCPFSSSADRAGLPAGGVTYPITHATTAEEVYEEFWGQVLELAATDERQISTVLLLTPRFALHSPGGFDVFADTLNNALEQLRVEETIQLVFFHPMYTFRDGKARLTGDDGAANFARRSPFPMINLLRTPQARKAQRGVLDLHPPSSPSSPVISLFAGAQGPEGRAHRLRVHDQRAQPRGRRRARAAEDARRTRLVGRVRARVRRSRREHVEVGESTRTRGSRRVARAQRACGARSCRDVHARVVHGTARYVYVCIWVHETPTSVEGLRQGL